MGKKIGGIESFFLEQQTVDDLTEPVKKSARTVEPTPVPKAVVEITANNRERAKKKDDDIRATFLVQPKRLDQLKAIAYWDRAKIKDVHDAALEMYIESRRADLPKVLADRAEKRK